MRAMLSSMILCMAGVVGPAQAQMPPAASPPGAIRTPLLPATDLYDPVVLLEAARALLATNDVAAVVLIATQAISEAPTSPHAYYLRGQAHALAGRMPLAASDIRKANVLLTARADVAYERYEALRRAGRFETALAELDRYLALLRSRTEALDALDSIERQETETTSTLVRRRQTGG